MMDLDARIATCKACPHFRQGQVKIETWCATIDDDPEAARNCEAGRYARWQARVTSPKIGCGKWWTPGMKTVGDDRHIADYHELLATNPEPPANLRGDVCLYAMFEANNRADLGIQVGISMLREVGWQGRVQFWHVGHCPRIDPAWDVEVFDAREVQARVGGECFAPWTLKSFAIRHGGGARYQWVDWDAYNIRSPTPIFAALGKNCMIHWNGDWSDRWGFNRQIHAAVIGRPSPIRPIQGGTYFLDCASPAGWKLLALQRFLDDRAGWWYPNNRNSDEEGWRLSIAATGANTTEGGALEWRAGAAWVNWHDGSPFLVHRTGHYLWSDCIPDWHLQLPLEERVKILYDKFRRDGGYNPSGRRCNAPPTPRNQAERIARIRQERGIPA